MWGLLTIGGVMEDLFARYVESSVNEVLKTMAGLDEIHSDVPYIKDENTGSLGDMSVIIGFSGETVRGTFVLHYSEKMAFFLLEKMFALNASELNEEVLDAVSEVTNMICGKIKTDVVNAGVPEFNITVPTIIVGKDFKTHIRMTDQATIFPFFLESADDNMTLNLELKVKKLGGSL